MSSTAEEKGSTVETDLNSLAPANGSISSTGSESYSEIEEIDRTPDINAAKQSYKNYLSQYIGQSGAHIIYSKLLEEGVTVVNGYSGGANLPLLDQFHPDHPRHEGNGAPIRWITNSNESSSGHVAEGYAKSAPLGVNGKSPPGVVVATSGPGLTNLITPLQDAICDGVPLVALCGQAATFAPEDSFQSAPAVALTTPCTKFSYQIKGSVELPMALDYAFHVATSGRPGPAFLDLPKDLQNQVITAEAIEEFVESIPVGLETVADTEDLLCTQFVRMSDLGVGVGYGLHLGQVKEGLGFEVHHRPDGGNVLQPSDVSPGEEEGFMGQVKKFHNDHVPSFKVFNPQGEEGPLEGESPLMEELVSLIRSAKKPIIIAGQGCNDAAEELKHLAETLQIPVCTTLHALGCFDERHPLALNMVGMHGHPTPNFLVQEADLIINIGSRFDDRITGNIGNYIPEARKAAGEGRGGVIHVDIRKSENAKQVANTFFVHSTGKKFMQEVTHRFTVRQPRPNVTADWIASMKAKQEEFPVKIPQYPPKTYTKTNPETGEDMTVTKTKMSTQFVVNMMNELLCENNTIDDCIFTTGVGIHQMVAAQLITWTRPRQMLSSGSLGTMGVSLGYAIGAKLANGQKIVISVDGDGSFNMTFTELKTVAEEKIPVKLLILNNDSQMMVEYWQRLFHDGRYLAVHNSQNPDYCKLADAFGIKNLYCDCTEDLKETMQKFLFDDPDEPVLFHVRVERTPCLPLVAPGKALDNMILEDEDFEVDLSAAPS